jgi:GTPase
LHKFIQLLGYADDTDIIGRSEKGIIEALVKLQEAAQQMGLKINEIKNKYTEATSNPAGEILLNISNYKFEIVKEFKYVGTGYKQQ